MNKVRITCDSTCDLTAELYQKCVDEVASLCVTLGEDLKRDGLDISASDIFEYVAKTGILPKTSAVSIGEYEEIFKKYVDEGDEVVHINISSELSACHQNAKLAAEEVGNVYVVDSKNLSTGSGLLVMRAKELAEEGLSAAEIKEKLDEIKEKVDASFVLQTLDYLQKGGRCSSVVAFGANLLKLRPEIVVENGKMDVARKYRGSAEKSILDYVRGRLEGRDDIDTSRIFVTHSHAPAEIVEKVKELVMELHPFEEVIETLAGCTITSHCGKDCLGVLFFKK